MLDVLVLCKDHPEYLERCIHHLDRQQIAYKGTLIDNSEDGAPTEVAVASPNWRQCLQGSPTLNYAASLNLALANTHQSHVLWLSDDAYLHDGALGAMVEADKPIVSALLLTSNGKVCFAGGAITDEGIPVHVGRGSHRDKWGHATVKTQWVTTPCALFRREVLDAVGPLDEAYEWLYEDVDYCLRARQLGFDPYVCFDAVCTHDEAGTKTMRQASGSHKHFFSKWQEALSA